MPLSQFAEPIESIGGSLKAYRMDSNTEVPDMRLAAGLGPCNCCDFVTVSKDNQSVFLIEETNLEYTIYNFRQDYDYLEEADKNKFFYEKIRDENRLKLYGSMLVLCRLSNSQDGVKEFLPKDKFQFWLVATGTAPSPLESTILMDHLSDRLRNDLKSPFGGMINEVNIIPSTELAEKLSDEAMEVEKLSDEATEVE